MHKQYEEEPRRIEHEDDATITFTIALHGPHAWEILLEDSRRERQPQDTLGASAADEERLPSLRTRPDPVLARLPGETFGID